MFVIRYQGLAGQATFPGKVKDGDYLMAYDLEAYGGRGFAQWHPSPEKALKFHTAADAIEAWHSQSQTTPLRHDGKPNRPLMAFTISVEALVEIPNAQ
jgi:hypothetical protein